MSTYQQNRRTLSRIEESKLSPPNEESPCDTCQHLDCYNCEWALPEEEQPILGEG